MHIVTAKEMYDIDRFALEQLGFDGKLLMENAGRAVTDGIVSLVKKSDHITIFTGSGNNGGDGYVIARTLYNKGYDVEVMQVVPDNKITGDALYHKTLLLSCNGTVTVTDEPIEIREQARRSDIVVDAIFGIGVNGILRNPIAETVSIINEEADCIIAVDIPSGLPADEGITDFLAINATYTFVIEHPKMSAVLQNTAPHYGKWESVSIGLPAIESQQIPDRLIWGETSFRGTMPDRKVDSHKGDHGKGLLIGGNRLMPGSIAMSVKAALRTGAGLITAGTTESVIPVVANQCPEATYLLLGKMEFEHNTDHAISYEKFDAVAVGMGMGRKEAAGDLISSLVEHASCPLIVDADGLHHLKTQLNSVKERTYPTIVTPHPGEMAMLLDVGVPELLSRPFAFSKEFAAKYQLFVVLKGRFTIITAPDGAQAVNTTGNPGLAKGGSGDVLSGIILAMVMQDQDIFKALCNACFVHGKSADLLVALSHSEYDLLATDVIDGISEVYRTFLR